MRSQPLSIFLFKISMMVSAACILAGCSLFGGGKRDVSGPIPAKVLIKYQYLDIDEKTPPVGFNVFRASSAEGPFALVNEEVVPAKKNARAGDLQIILTDKELVLGEEYYYYLEAKTPNGKFRKATDIARAVAVLPLVDPPPPTRGKNPRSESKTSKSNNSNAKPPKKDNQPKSSK